MKNRPFIVLGILLACFVIGVLAYVKLIEDPGITTSVSGSDSVVLNKSFDLDSDGRNEKLTIKSGIGLPGEEYTIIYLNDSQKPTLHLYGFFDSINVHTMDTFRHKVVEVRVLTGQSINMLAYAYQGGDLVRIPISTEKPPNYLGIVSRNYPEFKDIDEDGILELLAYYHFLGDTKRTVEVYTFKHNMFQKSRDYEEAVPSV